MTRTALTLALTVTLLGSTAALAATPLDRHPPLPPGQGGGINNAPHLPAPMPRVPPSAVKQAEQQLQGNYGPMDRLPVGGMIQESWNHSTARDGVFSYRLCTDCVFKVRLREYMTTAIVLPNDMEIIDKDVGNSTEFRVVTRGKNALAIQPRSAGIDTNLLVYTKSGQILSFYLRAEGFNSKNVPDQIVKIRNMPDLKDQVVDEVAADQETADPLPPLVVPKELTPDPKPKAEDQPKDFVREEPFNIDDLHGFGQYEVYGEWPEEYRPVRIFRDKIMTHIQFDDRIRELELPTAYVVVDGIDENVNTRIKGRTYTVERTARRITLRSGNQYLCIVFKG